MTVCWKPIKWNIINLDSKLGPRKQRNVGGNETKLVKLFALIVQELVETRAYIVIEEQKSLQYTNCNRENYIF